MKKLLFILLIIVPFVSCNQVGTKMVVKANQDQITIDSIKLKTKIADNCLDEVKDTLPSTIDISQGKISFIDSFGVSTKIADFNLDGVKDTLTSLYDGGSGFGGTIVTLVNGKTNERHEIDGTGSFSEIWHSILIPDELQKDANKRFLEEIAKELLPEKRLTPDPSLHWIINANISHKQLMDNPIFDLVINAPMVWTPDPIFWPVTYYVEIGEDTLKELQFHEKELAYAVPSEKTGWLIYYGHNHLPAKKNCLAVVKSSQGSAIYKTAHGVLLQKNDSNAWLFVTDYNLTGAPDKLRWESIGKVEVVDNLVFVQVINAESFMHPVFVIDSMNGMVARLISQKYLNKSFAINNGKIIIENEFGTYSYKLSKIQTELMNLAY